MGQLGISTIVTSAAALGLFITHKFSNRRKLTLREFVYVLFFAFILIFYYFLIKNITHFQIHNYVDAYADKGTLSNVKSFLYSVLSNASTLGSIAVAIGFILLLINFKDNYAKRIVCYSSAITLVFIFLSAVGLYPASSSKHVTWSAGFFWIIILYGTYLGLRGNVASRALSIALLLMLIALSALNIYRFTHDSFEVTENNQAVSFIENLPPSSIGLWIGGQPVVQYYTRLNPGLEKHRFFGQVNPISAEVELPKHTSQIKREEIHKSMTQPGGWGIMVIFRILNDYSLPATALVQAAPRGEDFYIFATHYDIDASEGYSKARVEALHQALTNAQCNFESLQRFKGAVVYKVYCPESNSVPF